MTYLINTLSVLAGIFILCNVVGYLAFRLELYLDNQIQGLITTDTESNDG
jgi:hypothetical protein